MVFARSSAIRSRSSARSWRASAAWSRSLVIRSRSSAARSRSSARRLRSSGSAAILLSLPRWGRTRAASDKPASVPDKPQPGHERGPLACTTLSPKSSPGAARPVHTCVAPARERQHATGGALKERNSTNVAVSPERTAQLAQSQRDGPIPNRLGRDGHPTHPPAMRRTSPLANLAPADPAGDSWPPTVRSSPLVGTTLSDRPPSIRSTAREFGAPEEASALDPGPASALVGLDRGACRLASSAPSDSQQDRARRGRSVRLSRVGRPPGRPRVGRPH